MPNGVKCKDRATSSTDGRHSVGGGRRSARLTLVACVVGLVVLITQLPGPGEIVAVLGGSAAPLPSSAPLAAVQSILLITAGALAWLLVAWTATVLVVGLAARLPGRPGRRARRLLPKVAPASVGRLVAAAVGVSLIAGTSACATSFAGPAASSPTVITGSESVTTGASSTAAADGSIVIDWPTAAPIPSPVTTPTSTTPPAPTSAAPAAPPAPSAPSAPSPIATTSRPLSLAPPSTAPAPTAPPPAAPPPSAPPPTVDPAPPPATVRPSPGAPEPVTVRPGDSLWSIAARGLEPGASAAEIDTAWRAWYFVNREVIGGDPDLITPGQSLRPPTSGRVGP